MSCGLYICPFKTLGLTSASPQMVGFVTYAKVNSTPHPASELLPREAWLSENDETKRVIIDLKKGGAEGGVEGGGE
jgi:hypothetical protein